MGQQTTTKVSFKVDNSYLTQENQDQEFFQTITRVTDLKSLDQAIHKIDPGLELLDKADTAYEEVSNCLTIAIENYKASQSLPAPIKITEEFLQVINSHKQKIG